MTRRSRFGLGWTVVAAGLAGGCGSLPMLRPAAPATPVKHASANLLDSGPTPKVSGKQAADVQFAIGRTAEEADQLDQAESAYRAALAKAPRRGDIEARLAIVLDRAAKFPEADKHFARALKLSPKNPDLLCDRGYSFYLRNRWSDAERSFRDALALDPKHPRSHTNLGLVLAARGDSAGAIAEFTRAGTDPADAHSNLALALALGGKVEDARDQYAQALQAKPTSTAAAEGLRIASTVLQAGSTGLPTLPGQPAPALAKTNPTPRTDPAVVPTALAR